MAFEKKERQKEEAMYMEDTQRLVTEIEMLKVVLYLVCRNTRGHGAHSKQQPTLKKNLIFALVCLSLSAS
jgi:hypothetical protein